MLPLSYLFGFIMIKINNKQVIYQNNLGIYTVLNYIMLVGFEEKQVQYSIPQETTR